MTNTISRIGNAYVDTTVPADEMRSGLWYAIFKVISDNVTNPKGNTGKWVWSSYPDNELTASDSSGISDEYPIIVINPITESYAKITLNKMRDYTIPFTIEIYSDRSDYLMKLSNDIGYQLEQNEDTLYTAGLKEIEQLGSEYNSYMRSGVKIHWKAMRFQGIYERAVQ